MCLKEIIQFLNCTNRIISPGFLQFPFMCISVIYAQFVNMILSCTDHIMQSVTDHQNFLPLSISDLQLSERFRNNLAFIRSPPIHFASHHHIKIRHQFVFIKDTSVINLRLRSCQGNTSPLLLQV